LIVNTPQNIAVSMNTALPCICAWMLSGFTIAGIDAEHQPPDVHLAVLVDRLADRAGVAAVALGLGVPRERAGRGSPAGRLRGRLGIPGPAAISAARARRYSSGPPPTAAARPWLAHGGSASAPPCATGTKALRCAYSTHVRDVCGRS
jgi:hypothetical protein